MQVITTRIRPDRLPNGTKAVFRIGVIVIASAIGGEQDTVENFRGGSVVLEFHVKVTIVMAASDPAVKTTIAAVVAFAPGGQVSDVQSFTPSLDRVIGIRTGE